MQLQKSELFAEVFTVAVRLETFWQRKGAKTKKGRGDNGINEAAAGAHWMKKILLPEGEQ